MNLFESPNRKKTKPKRRCKNPYRAFYTSARIGLNGFQPSFCGQIHLPIGKMKGKADRDRIRNAGIPTVIFKRAVKQANFLQPLLKPLPYFSRNRQFEKAGMGKPSPRNRKLRKRKSPWLQKSEASAQRESSSSIPQGKFPPAVRTFLR